MLELYSFGEVTKVLNITSSELNDLIASNKLVPVRHDGRLKFKKSDVNKLIQPEPPKIEAPKYKPNTLVLSLGENFGKSPKTDQFYSWDETLTRLQVEEHELLSKVEEGELQVYIQEGKKKFRRDEIESIVNQIMGESTMEIAGGADLSRPMDFSSNMGMMELPNQLNPLSVLQNLNFGQEEDCYTLDEVLNKLQVEQEELEELLINSAEITAIPDKNGKIKFRKTEIDEFVEKRMVEVTCVMEGTVPVEEDDDDMQPIVISAPSTPKTPPGVTQSHFTKEESDTLRPTLILPEDSGEEDSRSDTLSLEGGISIMAHEDSSSTLEKKSFYNFLEISQHFRVPQQQLELVLSQNGIKTYWLAGQKQIKRSDVEKIKSAIPKKKIVSEPQPKNPPVMQPRKLPIQNEGTLVLPLDERPIPKVKKPPVMRPPQKKPPVSDEGTFVLPLYDDEEENGNNQPAVVQNQKPVVQNQQSVVIQTDDSRFTKRPAPNVQKTSDYYSFSEALQILQMEKEELDSLINKGDLKCVVNGGKKYLFRTEVDELKTGKMIEPTIMVEQESDDDLLDENDDDIFFIS